MTILIVFSTEHFFIVQQSSETHYTPMVSLKSIKCKYFAIINIDEKKIDSFITVINLFCLACKKALLCYNANGYLISVFMVWSHIFLFSPPISHNNKEGDPIGIHE